MSRDMAKNGLLGLEKSAIKLEKMPESALILEKGLPAKICLNTFYTRIAFHEDLWLEAEWPLQKESLLIFFLRY
jgi:hypothetical protein